MGNWRAGNCRAPAVAPTCCGFLLRMWKLTLVWVHQGGFGHGGMRGHGHAYHQQMGHGNAPMAHMPPQMGAPGVQGMQPFTGMMMPGMGMGMPGMPDMPHMMTSMMGLNSSTTRASVVLLSAARACLESLIVVIHGRVHILLSLWHMRVCTSCYRCGDELGAHGGHGAAQATNGPNEHGPNDQCEWHGPADAKHRASPGARPSRPAAQCECSVLCGGNMRLVLQVERETWACGCIAVVVALRR